MKRGKLKQVSKPLRTRFGNVLVYFTKTPRDIVCPHFWELRWAFGCPFNCSYCYLRGTARGDMHPRYYDLDSVLEKLDKAFKTPLSELPNEKPIIANSGELADSLMNPPLIRRIAEKFGEQSKHKLLLLSKSANVGFLTENQLNQTIVSFSLNASKVADEWESPPAPSAKERIKGAESVYEAGYETRLRIDPMAPVKNWKDQYRDLIDFIFRDLEPERITLGSLRGLQKTIAFCEDDSWTKYLTESETGWGKKVGKASRLSMYSAVKDYLEDEYAYSRIALCKETPEIWRRLGKDPGSPQNWENCKCNCTW